MSFKLNDSNSKTFCPLAWNHSFINQDGSYQLCCTSEEFDNHIRDDKGDKIFISKDVTTKEVMNSNFMKNLRLDMLNGKWPAMCMRCKITEDHSGVSRRVLEAKKYSKITEKMLINTAPDGTSTTSILSADYRLGNLCNLQCRMCNPRSTALWIKDWNEIKRDEEKFDDETMDSYTKYDWINSGELISDFTKKAPTLDHIHFAGGEPLIVPQMRKVLEVCIASGNAKNITLTYNTNLVKMPSSVLELWKEFKQVKLLVSIDATEDLNHYIRYPSKWELIDKNLRMIDKSHKELNISECMISSTVQVLNILRLDELFTYLGQFNFIVPVPNLVNLHVPTYFKTTILPPKLKILATAKLMSLQKKYEGNIESGYEYLVQNISHAINFMNSETYENDNEFAEFLRFQKEFDKKKNLSLFDYYPHFKNYIVNE